METFICLEVPLLHLTLGPPEHTLYCCSVPKSTCDHLVPKSTEQFPLQKLKKLNIHEKIKTRSSGSLVDFD